MLLNEVFGPTVQGEGPHAGRRAAFVRFAGCNLSCTWCDTPYSWDWKRYDRYRETHEANPADVADAVLAMNVDLVVITGGEPMMQQTWIPLLARALPGCSLDVETNGTIAPEPTVVDAVGLFVVSPKLRHAGDRDKMRLKPRALERYAALAREGRAVFKIVVTDAADIGEAMALCDTYSIPRDSTWLMPEGADRDTHLSRLVALADDVVAQGFHLSTRLHVLAWDDKRGV